MKKLGLKNIVIIILGLALLLSFYFGNKSKIDYKKTEIKKLHDSNDSLIKINVNLIKMNNALNDKVEKNKVLLEENKKELINSERKIDSLTHEKNKIYNTVYRMSANDVSNSFTNYLNKREGKRSNR